MKNEDIRLHKMLLQTATNNLTMAGSRLDQVQWGVGQLPLAQGIRATQLAIQQTINVVVKILEDL